MAQGDRHKQTSSQIRPLLPFEGAIPRAWHAPVCMMGPMVERPEPETKLMTPGGKTRLQTSAVSTCARPPIAGNLSTAVFPISSAGISMAYISLSG